MPRLQRAAAAKPKPEPTDFPESSGASSSGKAAKTKVEHKSVEVRETITAKEKLNASVTVTKVQKTVKLKPKAGVKRKAGEDNDSQKSSTQKKLRASTKKNPPTMTPAVARTVGMKMLVGAHVSMAKGVQNAITNSNNIGGNAFALFLKSQRKWASPDMKESDAVAFRKACKESRFDPKRHILPHGSYLINLAQSDQEKAKQAYDCFIDDLKRCERLSIGLYNFHPGSTLGLPRPEALIRIAAHLNQAHKETRFVKTVLENMAGQGNIIGANFEDLRDIIANVKDKDRVGVCLDTCHLFAAGHDIRTQASYDAVMANFDRIVGREYLVALHLNDSKAPLGSNRDLHQNIGVGFLGLEAFRVLMNDKKLEGLPMVLETPMKVESTWAEEIKLLESLVGTSGNDPDFLVKAAKLSAKGEEERKAAEAAEKKKAIRPRKKGRKKQSEESGEDGNTEDEAEHSCEH
ncbi:xylose isomerase-like protein [Morchella snyderi]|nr:xylose isomerase-like protein [Morchella snyderi]